MEFESLKYEGELTVMRATPWKITFEKVRVEILNWINLLVFQYVFCNFIYFSPSMKVLWLRHFNLYKKLTFLDKNIFIYLHPEESIMFIYICNKNIYTYYNGFVENHFIARLTFVLTPSIDVLIQLHCTINLPMWSVTDSGLCGSVINTSRLQ